VTQGPHVGSRHPIPYAEGVEQQSMQATRQSTRKGSHNASQLWNPFGVLEAPWLHAPGCAAVRQPWALLFNAFGVGNGMTTGILTFWFHPGTRRAPASCHPRAVPLESTRAAERYICRQFEPGSEPGWRRPAAARRPTPFSSCPRFPGCVSGGQIRANCLGTVTRCRSRSGRVCRSLAGRAGGECGERTPPRSSSRKNRPRSFPCGLSRRPAQTQSISGSGLPKWSECSWSGQASTTCGWRNPRSLVRGARRQ
jgi:hypothetical protein